MRSFRQRLGSHARRLVALGLAGPLLATAEPTAAPPTGERLVEFIGTSARPSTDKALAPPTSRANPQSVKRTRPAAPSRTLPGFRSRCRTPAS